MEDKIIPKKRWEFDDDVAKCFDDMLQRSIPDYENMRDLVYNVGKHFVTDDLTVMDIGCSNGNAALPFVKTFGNPFLLLDVSDAFLDLCRRGFKNNSNVRVINHDLRQGVPNEKSCLILSILTIQFTPIEYRQQIIKSIYDNLETGGAFIIVEKLLGRSAKIDDIFTAEYYDLKREHRYTEEQIKEKRKSLEGVLVPVTENWNIDLLRTAGFKTIECFWRYLNFAGYLAVKE